MKEDIKTLREFGLAELQKRYGHVEEIRAQGIQRGSRVRFFENGRTLSCAIKVAAGGHSRIHFPYDEGRWGALSEVDRILYVRPIPGRPGEFEAQMHSSETIADAFNENRRAAEAGRFSKNLPAWLSADIEKKPRFAGSGFGIHALWKAHKGLPAQSTTDQQPDHPISVLEIIEQAKADLARRLGKRKEDIQINIQF